MADTAKKRSPLLPIFLIVVVDILGLTIILPLLPFYAERFGASPFVVGLLTATYAFCQLVAGPVLGQISDRVRRRPMLLVSQLGTFGGFLLLAFSNSLLLVFLSRVIDGVTAGNLSIAQAYISDVTEPKNRAKAFGIIGIGFGLGFLIGPAISGFLSQYGYQYPIFAAAGLSATSVLCTFFLLPGDTHLHHEADPSDESRRLAVLDWGRYAKFFRDPELGPILIQFFLFVYAFSTFTSGFALFSERRFTWHGEPFGPKEVGYVFAYSGFLGMILQGGVIGRLVKRFGEPKLIVAGFLASMIGYFTLGFIATVPPLLFTAAISSFGSSALRPCLTSLITQKVSRREQGLILGLNQSLNSIAAIVAPVISGLLIDHGMLHSWALLASLVSASALLIARKSGHVVRAAANT